MGIKNEGGNRLTNPGLCRKLPQECCVCVFIGQALNQVKSTEMPK